MDDTLVSFDLSCAELKALVLEWARRRPSELVAWETSPQGGASFALGLRWAQRRPEVKPFSLRSRLVLQKTSKWPQYPHWSRSWRAAKPAPGRRAFWMPTGRTVLIPPTSPEEETALRSIYGYGQPTDLHHAMGTLSIIPRFGGGSRLELPRLPRGGQAAKDFERVWQTLGRFLEENQDQGPAPAKGQKFDPRAADLKAVALLGGCEQEPEPRPWLNIPEHAWDRSAVELLYQGLMDSEIASRINVNRKTVTNRLSVLRQQFPAIVPTRERLKRLNSARRDNSG